MDACLQYTPLVFFLAGVLCLIVVVAEHFFVCRHSKVSIARVHKDARRHEMIGKEVFIDIHNVYNYVRCCRCKAILNGEHSTEPVYSSSQWQRR